MNLAFITRPFLSALIAGAAGLALSPSPAEARPPESPGRANPAVSRPADAPAAGASARRNRGRSGRSPARGRLAGEATAGLVVQFRANVTRPRADAILAAAGTVVAAAESPRHRNRFTVTATSPTGAVAMADALASCPDVVWAETIFRHPSRPKHIPSDAGFTNQWYLHNTGQGDATINHDIDATRAWDLTLGTSSVVIAILDDGVDLAHPDLAANVFINTNEYGDGKETNGMDDDHNGCTDDWRGWDFVVTNNDPSPKLPTDNHGTGMAGLSVAAIDNGAEGTAGLAGRCRFLSVRIQGDSVTSDDWANAIEYASELADVILISSYIPPAGVVYDAMDYALVEGRGGKGCVICTALGNDGVMRRYVFDAAAAPEAITVSGTSFHDKRSWFADYGPPLNLVAPAGGGGDDSMADLSRLFTSDRTGASGYNTNSGVAGNYAWLSGTSCANALAAGAAALVISRDPSLSGLEVRRILESSCDRIDAAAWPYGENGRNDQYGYGRLNAYAALTTPLPAWDTYPRNAEPADAPTIRDGEILYRSLDTATNVAWARFAVTNSEADVLLTVLGTTGTWLRLYGAATNFIANNNQGWPSYCYLRRTLSNGTYYARVESSNNTPIPRFGLHLALMTLADSYESDNTNSAARVIAPGVMQYRTLYPSGDVDWATFTLDAPATVEIRTMGEWDGWLELALWDTNTMVAYDYCASPTTHIATALSAGTYWIKVKDSEDYAVSSYQLFLETFASDAYEDDGTNSTATLLLPGQRLFHTLYPAGDLDWHTFTLTNRANVLILTDTDDPFPFRSATNDDTVVTLYRDDGSLQFVAKNDDGNTWYFTALFQEGLDPGTYYLKISGITNDMACPGYVVSLDVFEAQTVLAGPAIRTNGVELAWPSDSTFTYRIEYTDALTNTPAWIRATNIEGRTGTNRWTDDGTSTVPGPGEAVRRFYRVVTE